MVIRTEIELKRYVRTARKHELQDILTNLYFDPLSNENVSIDVTPGPGKLLTYVKTVYTSTSNLDIK